MKWFIIGLICGVIGTLMVFLIPMLGVAKQKAIEKELDEERENL